jgi:hypothetical protein
MASTFEWREAGSYFKHNGHKLFRREDGESSSPLRIIPSEMKSALIAPARLDSGVSGCR